MEINFPPKASKIAEYNIKTLIKDSLDSHINFEQSACNENLLIVSLHNDNSFNSPRIYNNLKFLCTY